MIGGSQVVHVTRLAPLPALMAVIMVAALPALRVTAEVGGEGREIAVVVDTSRSMRGQDSRRYTVQMLRILADLLSSDDVLTAVRMPPNDRCGAGPDPRLVLRLETSDRQAFDQAVDRHLAFDTGTYFAASLRTALAVLDGSKAPRRLLLVLADAGGLGRCGGELTPELMAASARGVQLAAVHLGRGNGAFNGHAAFESTAASRDAEELVAAVALVYQRFLGVQEVQRGSVVDRRVEATVAAHVARAFLVVAADGEVGPVRPAAGHPPVGELDVNYRGGGATLGLDGRRRSYRIVRLERPAAGVWRFDLPSLREVAGWMLVQESALVLRVADQEPWTVGEPARLVVEVYDHVTGRRAQSLPGLDLTIDGDVQLRDDGAGRDGGLGDSEAGDGLYTAVLGPAREGGKYTVRLRSELFDQTFTVRPETSTGLLLLAVPRALDFGGLEAGAVAESVLDLSASKVTGRFRLWLGSDLDARRVALEIDAGRGFEPLDGAVLDIEPSRLRFPLRLRVSSCPQAVSENAHHRLWLESGVPDPQRVEVALGLCVVAEPWLACWWPVLALGVGAVAAAATAHGLLVPSRFPPRAGLQLAQEEALDEGFFHPFRAQKASGSGFYRDARLFLHADYRLSSTASGALARLRADGSGVALLPFGELERRAADGTWEPLGGVERRLRSGSVHRAGDVYFELRHG